MRIGIAAAFLAGLALTTQAFAVGSAAESRPLFRSEAGQFAVRSAETPTRQERDVPGSTTGLKSHVFVFQTGRKAKMISYMDRPTPAETDAEITAVLDGARDGCVTSVKGTLKEEKKVTCRGYPGREWRVETGAGVLMLFRAYLAKNRLYSLVVGAHKSEFSQQEAADFMQSFTITR